jgi:hypothetical protein
MFSFIKIKLVVSIVSIVAICMSSPTFLMNNNLNADTGSGVFPASALTDNTPPTVIDINPPNGATNVATSSSVKAIFSESIQSDTVSTSTFVLRNGANHVIPGVVSTNSNNTIATFSPSSLLSPSTLYIVKITTGIKDKNGNSLAGVKQWSFTTGEIRGTGSGGGNKTGAKSLAGGVGTATNSGTNAKQETDSGPFYTKVVVNFLSIDVNDNNEGAISGDGEFDLDAVVSPGTSIEEYHKASPISLTDLSVGRGLWDVGNGERVYFEPEAKVPVLYDTITSYFPISIHITSGNPKINFYVVTYGYEVDGCGRMDYPHSPSISCEADANEKLSSLGQVYAYDWPKKLGKTEFTKILGDQSTDYSIKFKVSLETESQACHVALQSNRLIYHAECAPFLYPER